MRLMVHEDGDVRKQVGPGRYCPPRHRLAFWTLVS
jgi:hypothetical protein